MGGLSKIRCNGVYRGENKQFWNVKKCPGGEKMVKSEKGDSGECGCKSARLDTPHLASQIPAIGQPR